MDIMVRIPDDLALRLGTAGELERHALEGLALEEFRRGHLTKSELQLLLGFEARAKVEVFLAARGIGEVNQRGDLNAIYEDAPVLNENEATPALNVDTRARARQAAARIIERRRGVSLGGLNVKELIDEGRR